MVRDLDMGIIVEGVDTIRDPDGLAMSSRNVYLSPEDRRRALAIPEALQAACGAWESGGSLDSLRESMRSVLDGRADSIDYADIVDESTFVRAEEGGGGSLLAIIAVRVGGTRLIDNAHLRR
jgi:pantoate--beta-alanine ligase